MHRVKEEYGKRLTKRLINLSAKSLGENTLVGMASLWGFPADEHGDVVRRGAFRKTILEKINREGGGIPLLDSHIYDAAHTIGTVYKAEETEEGLKIWARLSTSPTALDIRQKMQEGHVCKLSIGYDVINESYGRDPDTKQQVRFLNEVKLFEVSVVPIPASDRTKVLEIKSRKKEHTLPAIKTVMRRLIDKLDEEDKQLIAMDIEEHLEQKKIERRKLRKAYGIYSINERR
ncbi:HK97 family phage prohead protease [Priestia sp. JV24]|uniref:HK97 family phage prohead protease n=1 Tax=Priestia TaxID=2800373 RepID=UPI0021D658B0|nr:MULTISPECIES: HK97 family phage prohead protease [Priestia]MCU7713074.1 HK97 family phage prohead protease [Priestia megaterium]MCW1049182.1 HK97 family phage prohead protease [Priestia sp. JV24]